MIPSTAGHAVIESNLDEHVNGQFTVDLDNMTHIMSVLTKMYSDPELAVVREYLTNAYDAQVEAGMVPGKNWTPIEITTSSRLGQFYTIRDYGVGLNVDDLTNVYSKYGASTKRGSNEFVGMLGIGSKSALSYTNQFAITGWKNGVKSQALISINKMGVPEFHVIDTMVTDEPNGVEIKIPIKDSNSFALKTTNFLKNWESGLVKVDGLVNKQGLGDYLDTLTIRGKKVKVYTSNREWNETSTIVMGHVGYPVDSGRLDYDFVNHGNLKYTAFVDIGAVAITPDREGLNYDADTENLVNSISYDIVQRLVKREADKINTATDREKAFKEYSAAPNWLKNREGFPTDYKGANFKDDVIPDGTPYVIISINSIGDVNFDTNVNHLGISNVYETYYSPTITGIITDNDSMTIGPGAHSWSYDRVKGGRLSKIFAEKFKQYLFDNGFAATDVRWLLVNGDLDSPWVSDLVRVTDKTIRSVKIGPLGTAVKAKDAPYDWYWADNKGLYQHVEDVDNPNPKDKIIYLPTGDLYDSYGNRASPSRLAVNLPPNHVLVVMRGNRIPKFKRLHPSAVEARPVIQSYAKSLAAKVTYDDYYSQMEMSQRLKGFLMGVESESDIDDPGLKKMWKAVNETDTTAWDKVQTLVGAWAKCYTINVDEPKPSTTVLNGNYLKTYPLLTNHYSGPVKHYLIYINAVYAANKENDE